jgi:hypothetical protein
MGARNGTHQQFTLLRDTWMLTGSAVGAVGANLTSLKGLGIASVARTSNGLYVLTLSDKWNALLEARFWVEDSLGTKHYHITVKSETVSTTKTITFTVFQGASTVAPTLNDLISTDKLKFALILSNSAQVPAGY